MRATGIKSKTCYRNQECQNQRLEKGVQHLCCRNDMKKTYELDIENKTLLTELDVEGLKENFLGVSQASKEQEDLEQQEISFYKRLMEAGTEIPVQFSVANRGKLSAVKNNIQLVYTKGFLGRLYRRENSAQLLSKPYLLCVKKVDEAENTVYFYSRQEEELKKKVEALIDQKLEAGEKVYLRGQIVSLQRRSLKYPDGTAVYVDINGLGIIGIIPCNKWTSGYKTIEDFRTQVNQNVGSLISFRVLKKQPGLAGEVNYLCDRRDYLRIAGKDPWKTLGKFFRPKMDVKVRIVAQGKSAGSFFGSIEGLEDLNFLCYPDARSTLSLSEIKVGSMYYGFIQKMDPEKQFARIRLTEQVMENLENGDMEDGTL